MDDATAALPEDALTVVRVHTHPGAGDAVPSRSDMENWMQDAQRTDGTLVVGPGADNSLLVTYAERTNQEFMSYRASNSAVGVPYYDAGSSDAVRNSLLANAERNQFAVFATTAPATLGRMHR
jgi:proteasome lid subunit RPN8/RPN11